ncbi:intein-containing Rv2578c family radical SAM protein [Haloechinothrix aidingensis]|uniref:intein-containing Rv2578c family radical SAM protein n=1 Tax=Haloechinothrix aidingensis TaxID=2752311 RepID=UPI001C60A9D8|nr:intein-containing Rv2578c family radical SAM protein [Haloechinothrix aidingensis]
MLDISEVRQPVERGTGRAGLGAPGSGPVVSGDESDAVAVEIRARSIINRVPGESAVPFRWTVNPYRGCSHACVYCLSGDTPILMADGRTERLSSIRVGDRVYGTRRVGDHLRYTATPVLAHWATVDRAYRVTLADGTTLVAGGDHRFLTSSGWKHVTGGTAGRQRRPYLMEGDTLVGTGRYACGPEDTETYRRGYLCGVADGAAAPGEYSHTRAGGSADDERGYRFRLASDDHEALSRTARYLSSFGVRTDRFDVAAATVDRRAATSSARRIAPVRVRDLVRKPVAPCDDWRKGFLAGIFDSEGSCSGGVVRVWSTDDEIITEVCLGLKCFGFDYTVEGCADRPSMRVVRLTGGPRERLRFFHTTDPAVTGKRGIDDAAIRPEARLEIVSIVDTGEERALYDITTGTGDFLADGVVSHNCFARRTHEYLDLDSGHDFDTKIMVKVNAGELVRKELAHPRWCGEPIAMGTNTDPYQRAEGRYRLMPQIIGAFRDFANPFSILTKGSLILRDAALIAEAARQAPVSLAVSVGSLDEQVWRSVEPGTPRPQRRLDVVRRFADLGIGCSVLMAPILPGLTDTEEQIEATVAEIAAAGATGVTPIVLHLRPGAREWYFAWLARWYPGLYDYYAQLYRRGAYAPKSYQETVTTRVRRAARRYGLRGDGSGRAQDDAGRPERVDPDTGEQLTLL